VRVDAAAPPDGGALLKFFAEQAPLILWSTDRDLRFTSTMGAALASMSSTPNRVVGQSLYEYFKTSDPEFLPIRQHRLALSGQKTVYEFSWMGRVFHARIDPMRGPSGAVIGTLGLALDITERKRAEAALQESEDRWKAMVSQAPNFVMILDQESRVFYINRYAEGFTPDSVIGTNSFDYILPAYHKVARDAYRRAFDGETVTYEVEGASHNKSTTWYRNRVGPLHRNGKVANIILISEDITESKRAEAALKASLAQMRRLAARLQSVREEEHKRIALDIHDRLGQSLTGLKLDLSSLARRLGADREGRRRVRAIFKSLDDTIQTVREISTGLRPAVLDGLGLRAAIEWQARDFQARTGLACSLILPRRDLPLNAERSAAVFRIFQEILTNVARHARAKQIDVSLAATPAAMTLTVADDGRGITKKSLEDPASLGLLGMRERALAFGGSVDIRGRRGKGTVVTVTAPLSRRKTR
jgi:PAS domain S-box-containing protein